MSFSKDYDQHQKESGGGDFFKFQEGDNKLRILSEPVKKVSRFGHGICYPGAVYCTAEAIEADYQQKIEEAKKAGKNQEEIKKIKRPSLATKWAVWAIDRANGNLVIIDLPNGVAGTIRSLMDSDEYKFKGWPMPYDITVNAVNAGKTTVEYSTLPARTETPLTAEELASFEKQTPIAQIVERMIAKKREEDGVPPMTEEEAAAASATPSVDLGAGPEAAPVAPPVFPEEEINPEDIPF